MKINTLQQLIDLGIRVELDQNGQPIIYSPKGNILAQNKKENGYLYVFPSFKGKMENITVHRISYIWFKGDIPEGMQIDHINRVRHDNRPANLQVLTNRENNMRKVNCKGAPKPVIATNIDTGEEFTFDSVRDAIRKLKLNRGSIWSALHGKYKRAGRYTFRYKED